MVLIVVGLFDEPHLEDMEKRRAQIASGMCQGHFDAKLEMSLSHTLTISVSDAGIRVHQAVAFGPLGLYQVDDYIRMGGARLRPWREADEFLGKLLLLTKPSVSS